MAQQENANPNMDTEQPVTVAAWSSSGVPMQYDSYDWIGKYRNHAQQASRPLDPETNQAIKAMTQRYEDTKRVFNSPVTRPLTISLAKQLNAAQVTYDDELAARRRAPKPQKRKSVGPTPKQIFTRGSHAEAIADRRHRSTNKKRLPN